MTRTAWAAAALLVGLSAGCQSGGDMPPTHPAAGRVVLADGKPLAGATVQFAAADPTLTTTGVTDAEGNFTLSTVKGTRKARGAVAGEYRVTIYPPIPADHRAVRPVPWPKPVKVEARDNRYVFRLAAPVASGKPAR